MAVYSFYNETQEIANPAPALQREGAICTDVRPP